MSEFVENTRNCLKNNAKIKRLSRFFFFIMGFWATFLLLSIVGLNLYFFYLMLAKILILFNVFYFTAVTSCTTTPQYYEAWSTSSTRIKLFKVRIKIAYWWTLKFSIFSTILFIFFRYSISASKKYSALVSQLTPSAEEILLNLISIILSLVAVYTMPYWYIARFIKIRRWDQETGLLKSEPKSGLIGFILIILVVEAILIVDIAYIHIILGLNLRYIEFLVPYEDFLLPLEIVILLLVVVGTYLDGKRQIRIRTDFVVPSPLGQVVVK